MRRVDRGESICLVFFGGEVGFWWAYGKIGASFRETIRAARQRETW
jgi:hypothetical protein